MVKTEFYIVVFALLVLELYAFRNDSLRDIEGFTYLGSTSVSKNSVKAIYYFLSETPANWDESFRTCNTLRGVLATPMNPVLDNNLRLFMIPNATDIIWTGGRVVSTTWFWVTLNIPMAYSKFLSPVCSTRNEHACLVALTQNVDWGWCFSHCNSQYKYVCEFEG